MFKNIFMKKNLKNTNSIVENIDFFMRSSHYQSCNILCGYFNILLIKISPQML